MKKPASLISAVILFVIALGHVLRAITGVTIVADGFVVPIWPSFLAIFFFGALGIWLLKERKSG